jgi:aminoglycoside phosphotransferase (APT) family kinase protein
VSPPRPGFPWHFALYGFLPGAPLSARADAEAARATAASVGAFLAALHDAGLPAMASPWTATGSEMEGLGWQFEQSVVRYPTKLRGVVEDFLSEPSPTRPDVPSVFAHADLMPDHILVNASGSLRGVIDWADAHTTSRCVDFAGLYYAGGREAAAIAYRVYGAEPDACEWAWLEHTAVAIGIEDVFYGCRDGQPERVAAALRRLGRLLV